MCKAIKVTTQWTRNQDMECINGKMGGFTKEIFKMIIEMDMENSLMVRLVFIEVIGLMENKFKVIIQEELDQHPVCK